MKILIIPDVHGRQFWKQPIEKYINDVDKIVFLGDYCDPYLDEPITYTWKECINGLQEIIELKKNFPDKIILLLGNHDEHYRNKEYMRLAKSTRYSSSNAYKMHELLTGHNENLFKLCYITNIADKKVIFSHAGISKHWLNKCGFENDDNLEKNINSLEYSHDGIAKLSIIGRERTWLGDKTGSILWCDIREFVSDESIGDDTYQIFGHTRLKEDGYILTKDNFSCIDSKTAFILDDDLKITKVEDDEKKS